MEDDSLGTYALVVWATADLVRKQFARPSALDHRQGFVLAMQTTGEDDTGAPTARLAVFDTDDPAEAARMLPIPTIWVTTAASLLDVPDHVRSGGLTTMYAIADLPIYEQLVYTWDKGARVTWTGYVRETEPKVHVIALKISAIPGVVWLHFATRIPWKLIREWFASLDVSMVEHRPDAFAAEQDQVIAALRQVCATWWTIDQLGGRERD